MDTIPFILDPSDPTLESAADDTKSVLRGAGKAALAHVPVERLRENLARLTEAVGQAFAGAAQVGDFALDEITLQVQVSAQGGIALIGSAKVTGTGAITLKFKRPTSE